jgi:hypothetical protein
VELGYIQGDTAKRLKETNYDPNLVSADTFSTAAQTLEARKEFLNKGPLVTMLDPATGKTEERFLPPYDDPASKGLWAPVLAGVRERLKARGLESAMMLGTSTDTRPSKEEVAFFHELAPGVPWVSQGHFGYSADQTLQGIAKVGYQTRVWHVEFSAGKSLLGWKNPLLMGYYDRDRELIPKAPVLWSHLAEMSITGTQRGVGRLGADYWPTVKDKAGRRIGHVWARYPQSSWRNLDLWSYALAPAPEGPVATPHLEYLREGVQLCEARIVIERALTDKLLRAKLGDELAGRCERALEERQTAMARGMAHLQVDDPLDTWITNWRGGNEIAGNVWFTGSLWRERSGKLFGLAGEVERALAK